MENDKKRNVKEIENIDLMTRFVEYKIRREEMSSHLQIGGTKLSVLSFLVYNYK